MSEFSGFHKGQVGALIRLDTEDDPLFLAAASKKEIHVFQPDGTTKKWTASLDGTKLTFTTTAITDLPYSGRYVLQSYIEGTGWKLHGERVELIVGETLIAPA